MSNIQLYLLEVDKDPAEAQRIAGLSAEQLTNKQLKLIDLITSLQEYINNKNDAEQRAKTVAYLADVLSVLPAKVLSGQERRLLVDFILGRLEGDLEGIGASARVLTALETLGKWDSETARRVMQTFVTFANPLNQFKQQTERYPVTQLLDLLLAKYREPIRELHESDSDFMGRFIAFFEGEKDPRNLMIVFSLLLVPMTEWNVRAYAQDLFESVFNYFPITFKPPPDDPYGITAQDLKDRLKACICANSDFAPYAFPQLLDKLDSTSMNTKRDVLQTLQACIVSYETQTINLYSITLWDALKFEILNVQEEDLAEGALKCLAMIAKKLDVNDQALNTFLRPITKECAEHLEDAPTRQSQAASRILNAVSIASSIVADKAAKGILPTLFSLFASSESITKRRGLLEVFNDLVRAYSELEKDETRVNVEALQAFRNEALGGMLRALVHAPKAEVSFRLTSLEGLALLASVKGVLSESDVNQLVDAITDLILHEHTDGHGDIRKDAIKTLIKISNSIPTAIRDRAIPAFMVELPDVPSDTSSTIPVLEAFAQLSAESQVFDTVVLRLKNKMNVARHQQAPAEYQRVLLLAILYSFTFGSPRQEDGHIRSEYYTDYVQPLVDLREDWASLAVPSSAETVGRLANIILRQQGPHFQAAVYNKDLEWLSIADTITAVPFLLYYYAAIRPEVAEPEHIISLLQKPGALVLNGSDRLGQSLRLISLLVNKFANPKTVQATLSSCNIAGDTLLEDPTPIKISLVAAITKGLILQGRAAQLTTTYLDRLLNLLSNSDEVTSTATAQIFTRLLAPDEILSKANHCLISGLYKQKLFNQLIPQLTTSIRNPSVATAAPHIKPNTITALAGILHWLPYSILQPSLTTLTPPLLQTLDTPRPSPAQETALTIFESILMHDPEVVVEHTSSLITRLLNATTNDQGGGGGKPGAARSAAVRAKALGCLALVPKRLKREAVVPFRRQVVKRLVACLDDPKRNVRGEAVRCRTAWLGLDEEEEDEE